MTVLPEVCERLKLTPMVDDQHGSAGHGVYRAGRSPHVARPASRPRNRRRRSARSSIRTARRPISFGPGHLFPLMAKEGGVLRRAGHTEAAVDLARMAGLSPAGVLCEILDD